jgi:hypothetical protein
VGSATSGRAPDHADQLVGADPVVGTAGSGGVPEAVWTGDLVAVGVLVVVRAPVVVVAVGVVADVWVGVVVAVRVGVGVGVGVPVGCWTC